MVVNEIEAIIPRILARGLLVLRRYAMMAQLVNRDYDSDAAKKGDTVDVDVPSPAEVKAVVPSNISPEPTGHTWKSIPIRMDEWVSSDFGLTDKERNRMLVDEKFLPKQANSAVTALVEYIDTFLLGFYKYANRWVGVPGKLAFDGSMDNAIDAQSYLKDAKIPINSNCYMVVNPANEGSALKNKELLGYDMSGDMDAIRNATITRKVGFFWAVNQGVIRHVSQAAGNAKVAANTPAGSTTIVGDKDLKAVEGDLFTLAGDTTQYVVRDYVVATKTATIYPALSKDAAVNAGFTFVGSHTNNLAFHPDAIVLATRPLTQDGNGISGNIVRSMTDPMTGLSLRIEVSRQHKQTKYDYDILFGGASIRPEFMVRVISK